MEARRKGKSFQELEKYLNQNLTSSKKILQELGAGEIKTFSSEGKLRNCHHITTLNEQLMMAL
jgi:hypothetical protein